MSSLPVLLWSVWLVVVVCRASALARKAMGDRYELPCGVGFRSTNRISSGSQLSAGRYPFMVSLRYKGSWRDHNHCGGVIINASHILTARHCFGRDLDADRLEVFVGSHDHRIIGEGERILIEPPISPPAGPEGEAFSDDIVFIKTKKPMEFFLSHPSGYGSVNRICMPHETDHDLLLDQLAFAGWGQTMALQELPMKVIDCPVQKPIDVYRNLICASPLNHWSSVSTGDAGGPLFWVSPQRRAYLIGILAKRSLDGRLAAFVDVRRHLH